MNIVEAFTKLKENPKLKIQYNRSKFIQIDGDLYVSYNNGPYRFIPKIENTFNQEEILATNWEVVE